ncbi:MAG: hypothetical protein JRE40_03365 [Deltaproteobacteria bacterium]|nr:hypothetical protein [Deltaproteobacteria bacterium]MBW2672983.1 hypothetical protein [Deltaproteobacteria bacterium]
MARLEFLLNKVKETFGTERLRWLEALREYLKTTPIPSTLKEIEAIEDRSLLRLLWSAGLSSELQAAVLKRSEELE